MKKIYFILIVFGITFIISGCTNGNFLERFDNKIKEKAYNCTMYESYNSIEGAVAGSKYICEDNAPFAVYKFNKSSEEYTRVLKENKIVIEEEIPLEVNDIYINNEYVLYFYGNNSRETEIIEIFNSIK
ncbi:MAG TPA: hypothetical protein PKY25_02480 [Bacilli bacterium]|nr:hypothetical protein [Bacilli bacterium]